MYVFHSVITCLYAFDCGVYTNQKKLSNCVFAINKDDFPFLAWKRKSCVLMAR